MNASQQTARLTALARQVRDLLPPGSIVVIHGASATVDAAKEIGHFSTKNLPPGISRRTFNERCRSGLVADAVKPQGQRSWFCSAAAWWAAARRPRPRTDRHDDPVAAPTTTLILPADDVDALLSAAGLRATRR